MSMFLKKQNPLAYATMQPTTVNNTFYALVRKSLVLYKNNNIHIYEKAGKGGRHSPNKTEMIGL